MAAYGSIYAAYGSIARESFGNFVVNEIIRFGSTDLVEAIGRDPIQNIKARVQSKIGAHMHTQSHTDTHAHARRHAHVHTHTHRHAHVRTHADTATHTHMICV